MTRESQDRDPGPKFGPRSRRLQRRRLPRRHGAITPVGIGAHDSLFAPFLEADRNAEFLGEAVICLDRFLDKRADLNRLAMGLHRPSFHVLDIQDVIDEANETLAIRVGNLED